MEERIAELERIVNEGRYTSRRDFLYTIVSKIKLVLEKGGLQMTSESNPTGIEIRTGSATTNASITAEVGTLPKGSIYLSSNGVGELWIMQTTTWSKVTIP